MDVRGKKLMTGNEALAEAAIMAGLEAYFGYPITPQNEIIEYMSRRMPELGRVFVQSESEVAAINMVFGAAATGKRVMTSSSSPGISLKQEGISYLSCAELPAVIVNIQRGGPGLGNIAPAQSDYFQATRGGGHGDYRTIVLGPSTVQEMADMMFLAFDLADIYRNPVMVLSDGVLGQMMEPATVEKIETGRELPPKDWVLSGCCGREQRIIKSLNLVVPILEQVNLRLQEKFKLIEEKEVLCEEFFTEDAEIVFVAYGIASRIVRTVVSRLRKEGVKAGWIRPITLWPYPFKQVEAAAEKARDILVVELSYGQMVDDVRIGVVGKAPVHFFGRGGGAIPTVDQVYDEAKKIMQGEKVNC